MSVLPHLRSVETLPQLQTYIEKHKGEVKGWLWYVAEQYQGAAYIGSEEREEWGRFCNDPEDSEAVIFFPKHANDSEMFVPELIDSQRLALRSVEVEVRSRHNVAAI